MSAFSTQADSLKSAYQISVARNILQLPVMEDLCKTAGTVDLQLANLYYASFLVKVQACQVSVEGVEDFLRAEAAAEGASISSVFKAVTALSNFGFPVEDSFTDVISAKLATEDTVMGHALAYLIASVQSGEVHKDLFDSIEDIAHRADTIGDAMSFEGGLMETAMFLKGAISLSTKAGASGLTESMIQKLYNYIVSNKDKSGLSNRFYTLLGLEALTASTFIPTRIVVLDNSAVISESSKSLKISLVDPLGAAISGSAAKIVSSQRADGETLFAAGQMNGNDGVFDVASGNLVRGVYITELGFQLPPQYIAPHDTKVKVKCVLPVELQRPLLKMIDVDDNRVTHSSDLSSGPSGLKADLSGRLVFEFSLFSNDGLGEVNMHQVFVRFTHKVTGQNVFFIAQSDLNKRYSMDLNFRTASAKSFGGLGGDYTVDLIVGDATLPSAMVLNIATLSLEMPDSNLPAEDLSKKAKPEITHMFREPEKRPPQAISMLFTGLIALPALVLLVVWAKLGANISNMKCSLPAIGFHGGLLAIITIYINFFVGVNMFTTVKCLSGVVVITFLCGQKLLASIAASKKAA